LSSETEGKDLLGVMPGRSVGSSAPVVDRLREIGRELPDLREAAAAYEAILLLLIDADLHTAPICVTPDQARMNMGKGLPLLNGLDLEVDLKGTRALMLRIAGALENCGENSNARQIRMAIEEDRLDAGRLLSQIASGGSGGSVAYHQDLDSGLLRAIAENALKPAFHAWRRQLTPLSEEINWNRGECFVCGATPILGELRDNNLDKHLRCGRCGADWQFRRLQCLYCGNEDHRTLSTLYNEDPHEKNRVEACEKCKGYLKVIITFSPTPPELLQAEDLATLHLDYAAQKLGYIRLEIYRSDGESEIT